MLSQAVKLAHFTNGLARPILQAVRDKLPLCLLLSIVAFLASPRFVYAADECKEIKKTDLPKELKQICGSKHPKGLNKAIQLSENKIAIECIFFSYFPTYSYVLAEKNKNKWGTKKQSLEELKIKDCFKH